MAPHATKRRKLSHSPDAPEISLDSPSSPPPSYVRDEASAFDPTFEGVDSDIEDDSETGVPHNGKSKEFSNSDGHLLKTAQQNRPTQPPKSDFQSVAYAGEEFKSNLFKLQVDELLEHVRPKQKRKDASIEHELRSLKSIIEAIPARPPISVRTRFLPLSSQLLLTCSRLWTLKQR